MAGSCCGTEKKFDGTTRGFRQALWCVIAINGIMFGVEMTAGVLANSQALKADALDFLGDTLTYGMSLAVIGMSLQVRATAALIKAFSLFAMGLWVLGMTGYQVLILETPSAPIMGGIGVLALAANLLCVAILVRYRDGDSNVRSVWLCSRNDAVGNVAVMLAAVGVLTTGTAWPDLVVAALMAGLFLSSATSIARQALDEHRAARAEAA